MKFLYGQRIENPGVVELEEQQFGISFPPSYKDLVAEHDGASLEPAGVRFVNPP